VNILPPIVCCTACPDTIFIENMNFFLKMLAGMTKNTYLCNDFYFKMKRFFIITLTLAMAFAPISMLAETERDGIEMNVSGIQLSINGGNVHIVGANGEVMEVFNLTGAKVATIRIDSNDKTFALNLAKGCYLVKVGKIVRKISVQ